VKLRWKPYDVANGDGSLLTHARHPVNRLDKPSFTLTAKGDGRGAQGACVLTLHDIPQGKRRGRADAPAPTLSAKTARAGVGESMLEWPWGSPSTTVNGQGRLAPPGHHPASGSMLSLPDAIVLSEKAAAILQGFPDGWTFHGATKKSRWSQIGMAMPPPLAHAVAMSVRDAMESM
jgi:site-specific DNA-cytosine methylase